MTTTSETALIETIEALRRQVAALEDRLARMEATGVPAREKEELPEELVVVLSAAIAAFLGKRPRIKSIRLVRSPAWAQEGRAFIQASHRLNFPHHT
jgi:methylmalonyl-CoA carboxyltransferase large subunit